MDGHGAGISPRMSRPIRSDFPIPSLRIARARELHQCNIHLEDRVTPCSQWKPIVTATPYRTHHKNGLRQMRPRARVRNAQSIRLRHGMRNRSHSLRFLTTTSNECKRCKVKCIRIDDSVDCQRCSTMKVACIVVPTATQTAKEKDKNKEKSHMDE